MIEFSQVDKQFGPQEVLCNVSLRILSGERVGVVGPNGSGKSTLFSLIAGEMSADRGHVETQRGLRVGMVHQQLRAHAFSGSLLAFVLRARPELDDITTRIKRIEDTLQAACDEERGILLTKLGDLETRYEHMGGYTLKSRAEAALCGLGFSPEELQEPFRSFSGGWQMRAELVRTLLGEPDILLLDEPSNYLDLPAVEWLQRRLSDFKGTLMLVSHDRFLLRTITDITVEVASGVVTKYPCGFDEYLVVREERVRIQEAAARNQQKRREQIETFVERFRAKNTKASQVQSRIKMLEKMEEIRVPRLVTDAAYMRIPTPPHSGAEVMRLEDAGYTYDGDRWIFRHVDLNVNRGDKIALIGFNGMGKTTMLRVLAGVMPPSEGKRVLGHQALPGYQSQDFAETMPPQQTVYRIVRNANPEAQEKDVRTLLAGFGFRGNAIEKPCEVLSGGEKIRLAFARLFVNPPNLLLLDEPTTHLDIQGCQTLEKALREYEGTIVLVSHDITFVRNVATNVIAMDPPGIRRYAGGYDYYRERTQSQPTVAHSSRAVARGDDRKERRRMRADQRREHQRRTRALEKEVAAIKKQIHLRETERDRIAHEISEGTTTDFASVNRRLKELQYEIDTETGRWEKLAEELDEIEQELAGS